MEEKKPLISIICAVRNDERFILETLQTVTSQTYDNWELIIMDGASTDGTVGIIEKYIKKHSNIILYSESDHGQWEALDKALYLSKGEYLFILCGQDGYLDNNWFERCVQVFKEKSEISLVWGIPFNMSEDGKLTGPHYAYANFLKDGQYGNSQIKPISTVVAKLDLSRPGSFKRLWRLITKITPSRIIKLFRSFFKRDIPKKEDWFFYWLQTGLPFPEGNMCVRKNVYLQNTIRFPKETMTNKALLDFCFNFNSRGYLSYGLSVAAGFGRLHLGGQPLRKYDSRVVANYKQQVLNFRKKTKKQKVFKFVDPNGNIISERILNS